jgi:hypothetical protein
MIIIAVRLFNILALENHREIAVGVFYSSRFVTTSFSFTF